LWMAARLAGGRGGAGAEGGGGGARAGGGGGGGGAPPPPAPQMNEAADPRGRRDGPRQYRAGQDLLPGLLGRLGGALLQDLSAGEDQVAAVLAEGHHAKLEHAADVLLAGLGAAQIHLRERTEPRHAPHPDP